MANYPTQGSPKKEFDPNGTNELPAFEVSERRVNSVFPRELRGQPTEYPFVSFTVKDKQKSIFLPIPPSLSFTDGAAYSSLNLGIIGAIGSGVIGGILQSAASGENSGLGEIFNSGISQLGRSIGSRVGENKERAAYAAASIFARDVVKAEGAANVIDFANRKVIAPNTNITFSNVNVRAFTFSFKLVAKDKDDSEEIRSIVTTFRRYLYPEGNSLILNYPPVWSIKFYNSGEDETGSDEMKYIPKIGDCYLTTFTSSYNGTTNLFHEDGSPTEVDISMSFQETKAHHRGEIDKIEKGESR
jgi:hypothetical protein